MLKHALCFFILVSSAWAGPGYMIMFAGRAQGQLGAPSNAIALSQSMLQRLTPDGRSSFLFSRSDQKGAVASFSGTKDSQSKDLTKYSLILDKLTFMVPGAKSPESLPVTNGSCTIEGDPKAGKSKTVCEAALTADGCARIAAWATLPKSACGTGATVTKLRFVLDADKPAQKM